jgi:DNA-binding protein H-NS
MALPNISKLTYNELLGLEAKVSAAIAKRKQEEKADLKRKIAALAKSSGFDLEEVVGARSGRGSAMRGSKVAPKYRHPKDAELTWTGRGRQPLWLVDEIKKGKKLESFLIK